VTATIQGTLDLVADYGGPQTIPFTQEAAKFGDWSGLAKTLLMISIAGAAICAVALLATSNAQWIPRVLGQGIVMTASTLWVFSLLSGVKDDLFTALDMALSLVTTQLPADVADRLTTQARSLVSVSTGIGFWMIALGSLIVLGAGIMGAMAIRSAQRPG
jgi:hypothetical protein